MPTQKLIGDWKFQTETFLYGIFIQVFYIHCQAVNGGKSE